MNLKQLQYFCEMVSCGSAAVAAKQLFVAPTAISMSVSQLETELGGLLFDRSTRPMPLTALGHFLHPRALELLTQTRRLQDDAKRVATARQGWLGIGFTRSVMLSFLPVAIRRFREGYPDVRLEMVELLSEHQHTQIAAGKIHLGISRYVDPLEAPAGFEVETLFEEPLLAALPSNPDLEKRDVINLSDLRLWPFITYPRDPKTRYAAQILAAAERLGVQLDVQYEAMEIHTALGLVAGGLGFTIVGASVALHARSDVIFKRIEGFKATSTVAATFPENNANEFATAFLKQLQVAAKPLLVGGIP